MRLYGQNALRDYIRHHVKLAHEFESLGKSFPQTHKRHSVIFAIAVGHRHATNPGSDRPKAAYKVECLYLNRKTEHKHFIGSFEAVATLNGCVTMSTCNYSGVFATGAIESVIVV